MPASIEFRRPGVYVQEVALPRQTGSVTGTAARSVIVGYTDRGPATPIFLTSWPQFYNLYGGWKGDGAAHDVTVDAVYTFFANSGASSTGLIFYRLTLPGAAAAEIDVTGEGVGTPVSMTIAANSPGTWGNNVKVIVSRIAQGDSQFNSGQFGDIDFDTDTGSVAPRFNVLIELRDYAEGPVVLSERYRNLCMVPTDRDYAPIIINGSSNLVSIDMENQSPTASVPVGGTYTMVGGLDGSGSIAADLSPLDSFEVPLTIYLTNAANSGGTGAVVEYVDGRTDSFAILDTTYQETTASLESADIEAFYQSLASPVSPYAAWYYPWININDPLRSRAGVQRRVAPGGSVLGAYARSDTKAGPWVAPAGTGLPLSGVSAPSRTFSEAELASLNTGAPAINVIRPVSGSGVCIMGARTSDNSNADRYIPIRRSLSYITANLKSLTEYALFQPNGTELWDDLTLKLEDWLGRYYQQGALRGAREPDAFYVKIDSSNNTAASIAAGEIHIEVGVAVEFPAEFIIIQLTQTQGALSS